ncbi:MAG TPA: class I SAM-dependent methyltransferase [Jatrophihabitantaceae bacterium]
MSARWHDLLARGDALLAKQERRLAKRRAHRMNPLEAYFEANQDRLIFKWMHYFEIYDRHFSEYRDQPVNVLEFGVSHGGSLQMWKSYFGRSAHITGVDIDPRCAQFVEDRVDVVIGDQEDRGFLKGLGERLGSVDVLIEDGGHTPGQQIATFEEMWPYISDGGVFLMEDLHTSYWANYDGGYKKPGTFVEYAKDLIDRQHAWYSREKDVFDVDDYTRSIGGMHVYDSIIVFDKAQLTRPRNRKTGQPSF